MRGLGGSVRRQGRSTRGRATKRRVNERVPRVEKVRLRTLTATDGKVYAGVELEYHTARGEKLRVAREIEQKREGGGRGRRSAPPRPGLPRRSETAGDADESRPGPAATG